MELRLKAVRGATSVDADQRELIVEAARELTQAVLEQNEIQIENIVSIIYTATPDLVSEFPAVGARMLGLVHTPLICAQEIPVVGAQPRCVRLLMHAYVPVDQPLRPIYLKDAVALRPDLQFGGGSV